MSRLRIECPLALFSSKCMLYKYEGCPMYKSLNATYWKIDSAISDMSTVLCSYKKSHQLNSKVSKSLLSY